jgi:hypothetical protein
LRSLGTNIIARDPAKLQLTLHVPQFRVGGRFDHRFQIAADAAQCSAPVTVHSAGPTEAVAAERRPVFVTAGAISSVAGKVVDHLRTTDAALWTRVASESLDHLNRHENGKMLAEAADGAGMAIVFGNILDTIPGCLVIGAKFTDFGNLSLTLMLGMFLGGIPEAASASMLTEAGYRPAAIFGLWSTVLLAGVVAAAAEKAFVGGSEVLAAIFAQALAGGAVLALVAHAMIPVALEEGGSLVVLPTVAGFLLALYLALAECFG